MTNLDEKTKKILKKQKIYEWYEKFMKGKTCSKCGWPDVRTLIWYNKEGMSVKRMLQLSYDEKTIEVVMNKCKLLCANCHKIETYEKKKKPKEYIRARKKETKMNRYNKEKEPKKLVEEKPPKKEKEWLKKL